jgi:carboxymethylenebutenolidase
VFGVNAHIRDVCDRFAEIGYRAIAPALFDRIRRGIELDYDEDGIGQGRGLVGELGWEMPVRDVWTAARALDPGGKVAVAGYCWGGTVAFLAGCRLGIACAAPYYGRQIVEFLDETPRCPMVLHFGAEDALIPQENVDRIARTWPDLAVHRYEDAGHGFNCDRRADFRPDAAKLALERTLALFQASL